MTRFWKFCVVIACTGLVTMAMLACGNKQLEGTLQKIDSVSGQVTVKLKDGSVVDFNLKDVKPEAIVNAVGLPSLETGDAVVVERDKDKKVTALKTNTAELEGTIKALDNEKKTAAIVSDDNQILEVKVGDGAAFTALREGQWVTVKYNVVTIVGTVKPVKYSLVTEVTPLDSGNVSPSSGRFDKGTNLLLKATPRPNYEFIEWVGTASGTSNPLSVKMDSDKKVVASFKKIVYPVGANAEPLNGGTVSGGGTYDAGSQRSLTATPNPGYRFDRWGGSLTGAANPISFLLDGNKLVTAYFTKIHKLTTSSVPSDGGTINPVGGVYDAGTKVDLSLTPSFPYYPTTWTGADNNNVFPTKVTMDDDKHVTATFARSVEGPPRKASGVVYRDSLGRTPTIVSIKIQLNQFEWVQGEIIFQTPNTANTPVRAYIQDPAGNIVKDFGSIKQTNFNFMAAAAGQYTVVLQNESIWYASYNLTYSVWGKPQ